MDRVQEQYEAFPYPERNPEDERRRLVTGSPSDPVEIDHFVFRGRRDWRQPFRALVAGGGTGDGLIQLAQGLATARVPAEIVYLDLSRAARAVAEARAAIRGLDRIRFVTGDLAGAPGLGPFDYIDCCGVLHHLADPGAGLAAIAAALAPGGGMGIMVYAPHGRTGVYPLQDAFGALFGADAPAERVALARAALAGLPERHWFRLNRFVGDHLASDAGFHDLLLHGRDRPYAVEELHALAAGAGLRVLSLLEPARYDPLRYLPDGAAFRDRVAALDPVARMGVAERLAGDMKLHIAYLAGARDPGPGVAEAAPALVPRLNGVAAAALADTVARRGAFAIEYPGHRFATPLPRAAAGLIRLAGGRPLGEIAARAGLDWIAFRQAWAPVEAALAGFNRLHYSGLAR